MKRYFKVYIPSLLVVLVYCFIKLPVISFNFLSIISVLIIFLIVSGVIDMTLENTEKMSKLSKRSFTVAGILVIYSTVAPIIMSTPIFHAKQ